MSASIEFQSWPKRNDCRNVSWNDILNHSLNLTIHDASEIALLRDFYRPQTKFAKVTFLHVSACPQGGGLQAHTQGGGWEVWPGDGGSRPRPGGVSQHALRQTTQQTATAADGTHPTGMHSFFIAVLIYTKVPYLPPATKLRQGNVFTPVCHSVHRGGLPYPPGQTPPWTGTPSPAQCMLGYDQQAGGTHPTGMQSCTQCAYSLLQTRTKLHFSY